MNRKPEVWYRARRCAAPGEDCEVEGAKAEPRVLARHPDGQPRIESMDRRGEGEAGVSKSAGMAAHLMRDHHGMLFLWKPNKHYQGGTVEVLFGKPEAEPMEAIKKCWLGWGEKHPEFYAMMPFKTFDGYIAACCEQLGGSICVNTANGPEWCIHSIAEMMLKVDDLEDLDKDRGDGRIAFAGYRQSIIRAALEAVERSRG